MAVSVYAVGTAKIEVGRYGSDDLYVAKEWFYTLCKKHKVKPQVEARYSVEGKSMNIRLKGGEGLHSLLSELADVEDLHGDPPDQYILQLDATPSGEYAKTGSYND